MLQGKYISLLFYGKPAPFSYWSTLIQQYYVHDIQPDTDLKIIVVNCTWNILNELKVVPFVHPLHYVTDMCWDSLWNKKKVFKKTILNFLFVFFLLPSFSRFLELFVFFTFLLFSSIFKDYSGKLKKFMMKVSVREK